MRKTILRIGGVLIALTLVLGACSSDDDDNGDDATDTTSASATTATTAATGTTTAGATTTPGATSSANVTIKGFAFNATPVKAGSKVTVKNEDSVTHTFTADDKSFDTDRIDAGKTAEFTAPTTTGDYKVHCEIHSSMTGTLTVT
jgi:plastocyanin